MTTKKITTLILHSKVMLQEIALLHQYQLYTTTALLF